VTVVIASHNYPGTPRTGDPITGLADVAEKDEHAYVLHAGTKLERRSDSAAAEDRVVSAGGRVLSVTATGSDLAKARERAYRAVGRITLDGSHYRGDIAAEAAEGKA
jgi:phosphoribosylamine--glycine ligase